MNEAANYGTKNLGNDTVRLHKDRLDHRYGMRCLGIAVRWLPEDGPQGVMTMGDAVNGRTML